ncbi:uncharacterized protein LOC124496142 [Dermatophagoides farinae]|uniref:uncharacterized protein LOC124496142 n=1 Tax=Dermatophagoides farinae TaxID=6954 RepID=UPI003F5E5673
MPWIRAKPKPVSFDIFLIRILDYVEMRIKNELPIVHRIIYRCPPDEYIVLRRLFCMFGGYLVCKLLLILCVELPQTPEDKDSIFIHKWGLVIMIIGFVFSVQIRTVICLLLPSLIITSNGIFFYLRLVQRTQHVLLPSVIGNIRALWSMISCLINFRQSREKAMSRLAARPIIEWFTHSSNLSISLTDLNDLHIVKENLTQAFKSFQVDVEKLNGYCDSLIEPLKNDDHCSSSMEKLYNDSNILTKQIYNQVYNVCYKAMDEFNSNFCSKLNEPFEKLENFSNHMSNYDLLDSLELVKSGDNFKQMNEALEMWQSLVGYRMDIEEEFRAEFEWIGLFGVLIRLVFLGSLISGMIRAIFYHNRYLRFSNFDNHYIDRYFYHIDNKRKVMNKIHLLPLRGNDRWQLIPTFSLKRSIYEKAVYYKLQKKIITVTLLTLAIVLYIDYIFSECVNLMAAKLSTSDHFDLLVHRYHPKATGGIFAIIINNFVGHFHFNYTELFRHDWHTCRQSNPKQLGWPQYQDIFADCILLILLHSLAIHFVRCRHLICDFFYYRYGKQRNLYLYNQKLINRKRFLRFRRRHIDTMVQANRMFAKELDPIHQYEIEKKKISKKSPLIRRFYEFIKRKILSQRKQCFTCHVLIKPPYYFCSSINCRLIYCEPCFSDFLLTCLNCGVNGPPYVCLFD